MIPPVMLIASILVVLRVARIFSTIYGPGKKIRQLQVAVHVAVLVLTKWMNFFAPDCNMVGRFILEKMLLGSLLLCDNCY